MNWEVKISYMDVLECVFFEIRTKLSRIIRSRRYRNVNLSGQILATTFSLSQSKETNIQNSLAIGNTPKTHQIILLFVQGGR